jgi:hypothetical protein
MTSVLIIGIAVLAVLGSMAIARLSRRRADSAQGVGIMVTAAPKNSTPIVVWWAIGAVVVVALAGGYMLYFQQKNDNLSFNSTSKKSNQPERVAFAYKYKGLGIANEIWGEARGKGIPAGNYCQHPAGLTLYFLAGDQAVSYLGSEDIVIPPGKKVMAIKTDHNEVSVYPGTCKEGKNNKPRKNELVETIRIDQPGFGRQLGGYLPPGEYYIDPADSDSKKTLIEYEVRPGYSERRSLAGGRNFTVKSGDKVSVVSSDYSLVRIYLRE